MTFYIKMWWFAALACMLGLAPLAQASELMVEQGYARATPPGVKTAAAYLTLNNLSDRKLVLVAVTSNRAAQVMVHQNQLQDGMMRMRPVSQLEVAAHSRFQFEPGGHHLMLMGLAESLQVGEQLQLSFQFEQGLVLQVSVPVVAMGAGMDMNMKDQHE